MTVDHVNKDKQRYRKFYAKLTLFTAILYIYPCYKSFPMAQNFLGQGIIFESSTYKVIILWEKVTPAVRRE